METHIFQKACSWRGFETVVGGWPRSDRDMSGKFGGSRTFLENSRCDVGRDVLAEFLEADGGRTLAEERRPERMIQFVFQEGQRRSGTIWIRRRSLRGSVEIFCHESFGMHPGASAVDQPRDAAGGSATGKQAVCLGIFMV